MNPKKLEPKLHGSVRSLHFATTGPRSSLPPMWRLGELISMTTLTLSTMTCQSILKAMFTQSGRTGRAGADGVAISFCTPAELTELHAIEQMLGKKISALNPEQKFRGKPAPKNPTHNGGSRQKNQSGRRRNNAELREGAQNNHRRRKKSRHGESKPKNAKLNPRKA